MFGETAANFLVIISASQFHLPFYLSRTLPNVFALAVCLRALHHWLEDGQRFRFVLASAVAVVIFRGELALLLGTAAAADLLVGRKISVIRLALYGVAAVAVSLALTVAVDSYFWGRFPLWPEGQVRDKRPCANPMQGRERLLPKMGLITGRF